MRLQAGKDRWAGDGAARGVWLRAMRARSDLDFLLRRAHLGSLASICPGSVGERAHQDAVAVVVE